MTVFEASITDGIIGGDGLEVADLAHVIHDGSFSRLTSVA